MTNEEMSDASLVSNFPLKECDAEKKEIVFVLDCIDSVIEQIDFIQQTEQYLRQERNWNINSRTYVTFKEDGLTQLDVKTFNSTELHLNTITSQCSNETDVDTMFERINNFFTQERSTLKISFVLLKRTRTFFHNNELKKNKTRGNKDGLKLIAEKSKTEKSFHRNHFFINDLVENKLKQHTHIHYVDSFSASTIYTIFPLVCDLKCTKTKFKHQNSVQKSFYHLGMKPNMSHDQAIEFCLKDYNSYLVSIETYTEFKYLMSEIKKDSKNYDNFDIRLDYFKCPNSFFVPIKEVNDRYNDCPFGEDEMLFTPERKMCKAYVTYLFKDMCFKNNRQAELLHLKDYKKYNNCAIENCYSFNTINENNTNEAILFQIPTELYNISNYFMYLPRPYVYPTIINIIGFYANSCKIKRFDQAFQTWKLSELVVLDISRNDITNSSQIQTIRDFSSLTLLNMSFNENFKVQKDFLLPNSIEILDLSHTGIESMPKYFFQKLRHLKYLNLSHTMILEFQHIGIPEYFHLDSLDLRGVEFTYLKADFFKGLTIRHILRSSDYKICCPQVLNVNITRDKCEAPDDVISSCSHLIGDTFKQIVIWIVGLVTFIGNSIVLIYWLGWDKRFLGKPYGLFIIGLAVSDFLMGIYLLIIAATDIYYRDNFVLEDIQWRYSHVCYFAGFLATLSSETSTFFICLATLDRLLIVKFPHGQLRITKRLKWSFFILSWLIGFVFALTPVIVTDWEIYSSNGLCLPLPLSSKRYQGWQYSVAIFVILNFLLFLLITLGQAAIFISFRYQNIFLKSGRNCEAMKSRELTVAKKLALVALSDFLCWFPVGILGMLSLNGQLFDNEVYAWVAVFVLPVNSALNPIIYTIPVVVTRLRSYVVNESQEIKPKKK
ncbi:hypothetical protein Btru_031314 [Bulinus truncatus]|nr:hypothetical protein Btru_031314 [Bulinus truncatus]